MVSGEVEIVRSGQIEDGFSTWAGLCHHGVREVHVSAVGGSDAGQQKLDTLDARIKEAGGAGLKEDGVFNNAYIVAGADSAQNRAAIATFNESFSAYYAGTAPAGRTAQFVGVSSRKVIRAASPPVRSSPSKPVISAAQIIAALERHGVTHVLGVPDNGSCALYERLWSHGTIEVILTSREGEAYGLASGLYLGGAHPLVLIQNTGFLEAGDAFRGTA